MLREKIQEQIKQAMRNKDQVRLAALRYLWSEVKNAEIDAKVELDEDAIVAIVNKEVKKRGELIEQLEKQGRKKDAVEEIAKVSVLEEFVERMSQEELEGLVSEAIEVGAKEFGEVMKQVMVKVKGRADGRMVSEVVKRKLSS